MKKSLLVPILASVLVSGCSYLENNPIYGEQGIIRDRSQDYEKNEKAERLNVPKHLDAKAIQDSLKIPEIGAVATARTENFRVPRPEFFYAEAGSEAVSLKRHNDEKLIIVDEGIGAVWVKLQEFWKFNGLSLSKSDPQTATMETQWVVHQAKEYGFVDTWIKRLSFQDIPGDTKDKLQVRLRPVAGAENRTSISMRHVRFPAELEVSEIDWNAQARGVTYKSDMMFEMLRYLAKASGERNEQTLLAFQEKQRKGTQFGRDSRGNPVLKLDTHIDAAWAEVNSALDKAQLDVGTRDQSIGYIYMTYTTSTPFEAVEEMGFFEWLHSDRGDIKISTAGITDALGLSEEDTDEIRYSSKYSATSAGLGAGEGSADVIDADNKANSSGYKIWFGNKPIFVFGGDSEGTYNDATREYEHTGAYQLRLIRTRLGVFLSVYTSEGISAPAIVAEEILWEVKEHLPNL